MPAPEMALSMAAAKAHRIRLGTSVFSAPFHHPFYLAERMAFLDHLTRGRAILGVGPCSLVTDKMLFNMEDAALVPMLHEAVDVIVRLLESDEPISHHGEYWQFDDMQLQLRSFQQPRLPLAMPSAATPANLEMIGRNNMIWMSPTGKNRPDARKNWDIVEKGAREAGRAADRDNWRIATYMYVAESRNQAWDEVRAGIMREAEYFSAIGLRGHYAEYEGQPYSEFTPESCADIRDWMIGTPDDAIAWLEANRKKPAGSAACCCIAPNGPIVINGNAPWRCLRDMLCLTSRAIAQRSKTNGTKSRKRLKTVKSCGIPEGGPAISQLTSLIGHQIQYRRSRL